MCATATAGKLPWRHTPAAGGLCCARLDIHLSEAWPAAFGYRLALEAHTAVTHARIVKVGVLRALRGGGGRVSAARTPDLRDDGAVEREHPDLRRDDEDVAGEHGGADAVDEVGGEVEDEGVRREGAGVAVAVVEHDLRQPRAEAEHEAREYLQQAAGRSEQRS